MSKQVGYRACNKCGFISIATYGLRDGQCKECGCVAYCLSDTAEGAANVQKQLVKTLSALQQEGGE